MGQRALCQFVAIAASFILAASVGAQTSSRDSEGAKCLIQIWVRFTGQVQVAQIAKSSGAPRLDEACVKAVLNQTMRPGSRDGILADTWVTVPIVWNLKDLKGHNIPAVLHDGAERPIALLARDQALNLDPPYDPRSLNEQALEAICDVHAKISTDGTVVSLRIEHSSGSTALDQASMDALYAANFIVPQEGGKPVEAESDIWLAWGSPRPSRAKGK